MIIESEKGKHRGGSATIEADEKAMTVTIKFTHMEDFKYWALMLNEAPSGDCGFCRVRAWRSVEHVCKKCGAVLRRGRE